MSKYRKKPVVIEARRLDVVDKEGMQELCSWCGGVGVAPGASEWMDNMPVMYIDTLEGRMFASPGDWIIKGVQGEFYPVKDAIFRETYEPADA